MKNYKVYLIRDKVKKIIYVGLTGQELSRRFNQHCSKRQWKHTDYAIELVQEYLTLLQAVELEEMLIVQYQTRLYGLNVSPKSINGYSNEHSEAMKEKWSKERRGVPVSPEHAAKNRVARLGKTNSEHHKAMVSQKKSKPVMCLNDGLLFPSARKAAAHYKTSYSKISNVCTGKRAHTRGLRFKFT